MKLIVTETNGDVHTLEAHNGWRVMEVIKEAGIPMRADCGGCCACATCHVYVDDAWLAKLKTANDEEMGLLEDSYVQQANSRLACQITMTKELDGLAVTISNDAT